MRVANETLLYRWNRVYEPSRTSSQIGSPSVFSSSKLLLSTADGLQGQFRPVLPACQTRSKTRPGQRSISRVEKRVIDQGSSGRTSAGTKVCALPS